MSIMSVSYWLDQNKDTSQNYDVVIIGGGISGVSTAYWLKKQDPTMKIAILEKSQMSAGATGRNAGFITCGSVEHFNRLVERWGKEQALKIWQFSETNLDLLKSEIIENPQDIDFEQKGSFSLASTETEFAELKKTAELMQDLKIAVEVLNQQDIETRLGAVQFVGGIKYVCDAAVNPCLLTQKIFEKSAADFFENTEVFDIEEQGSSLLVKTNQKNISTPIVVLATNGYTADLHPYFKDKIYPTRGQILVTEPVERFMEGPCYANFVLDYFRQLKDGSMLIGGFRQLEKETEVGYSDHVTEKIQSALFDFLQKHIPQIQNKKINYRWGGVMGFSADGQPLIGSLPDNPKVFFLGGFTAHGLGLAFHTAKALVDLLFENSVPEFILSRRF